MIVAYTNRLSDLPGLVSGLNIDLPLHQDSILESPRILRRGFLFDSGGHRLSLILIIQRLVLNGRNITNRFEQTAVIEPVYPLERGVLDLLDVPPRCPPSDHLGFVQAVNRFGQCVVIAVANAPYRGGDAGLGQTVTVANRQILCAGVLREV